MIESQRAVTSLSNPRVKAAVRLRDRGERDATGLTIVDGPRELLRALVHGVAISEAFICDELIRTTEAEDAVRRLRMAGASTIRVSPEVMAKVAFGDRSDGVVAIIRTPDTRLDRLTPPSDALVVVVESVEKPGNLGAILADGRRGRRRRAHRGQPADGPVQSERNPGQPRDDLQHADRRCHDRGHP